MPQNTVEKSCWIYPPRHTTTDNGEGGYFVLRLLFRDASTLAEFLRGWQRKRVGSRGLQICRIRDHYKWRTRVCLFSMEVIGGPLADGESSDELATAVLGTKTSTRVICACTAT